MKCLDLKWCYSHHVTGKIMTVFPLNWGEPRQMHQSRSFVNNLNLNTIVNSFSKSKCVHLRQIDRVITEHQVVSWSIQSGLRLRLHISATSCYLALILIRYFKENLQLLHMWSSLRIRTIYYILPRHANLLVNHSHLSSNDSWDSQDGLTNTLRIIDFIHFILSICPCSLTKKKEGKQGRIQETVN